MADPLRPLRVNAVELLRVPGSEQEIELALRPDELGVDHPRLAGCIEVSLRVVSSNDGVFVRGTVHAPWTGECRRCLASLQGVDTAEIDEVYQLDGDDPDAFPIVDQQLDLVPAVRETLLLTLEDERLCRPDCAGLCPVCGVDRNVEVCSCDTSVRDERWAVLDELTLDE